MTVDQTANFVRGSVASSIGGADTTISVDDASIYPDPTNGEYNLVLWDFDAYRRPDLDPDVEIVRVTGRDTTNNDLTVIRGEEGTSAVSHPSTSDLHLAPTSKVFTDIDTKIDSSLTISGGNGLNGGSAQLGGTINVGINGNLSLDSDLVAADGETIWDESATYIPTARLQNDAMTIAGNSVSLGGSTAINHTNLSNINSDDHHSKYTDSEALSAVESGNPTMTTTLDMNANDINNVSNIEMDGNIQGAGVDITVSEVGAILGPSNYDTDLNIETQGDGTHQVSIRDGFGTQDIARFNEGGNVEIPNGELTVGSSGAGTINARTLTSAGVEINAENNAHIDVNSAQSATKRELIITANAGNDTLAVYNQGGRVDFPGGKLAQLGGTTDANAGTIRLANNSDISWRDSGNNNDMSLDVNANDNFIFRDGINSQDVFRAKSGGNVEIPNGNLSVTGNAKVTGPGNISYHLDNTDVSTIWSLFHSSGGIGLGSDGFGLRNTDTGTNRIRIDAGGNQHFYDSSEAAVLYLLDGGNVKIPNGSLEMSDTNSAITDGTNHRLILGENETSLRDESGQSAINVNSTNELDIRTRGYNVRVEDTTNNQDIARFKEGGNVEIPNGNLEMGSGAIQTNNFEVEENSSTNSLDFNYTG